MSKILIIKNCDKCPGCIKGVSFDRMRQGFSCVFEGVEPDFNKIPDNCPLPDLPDRKEEMDYLATGWNAALDEILEGNE